MDVFRSVNFLSKSFVSVPPKLVVFDAGAGAAGDAVAPEEDAFSLLGDVGNILRTYSPPDPVALANI